MAGELNFNLKVDTRSAVQSINTFFQTIDQGAAQAKSKLNSALGERITTEVDIEFKNGEVVAKKIEGLNTSAKKLQNAFNAVNGPLAKTPKELRKQQSILKDLISKTSKFRGETKNLNSDWTKLTSRLKQVNAELGRQSGASKNFLSGLTGKFAVANVASQLVVDGLRAIQRAVVELAQTGARMELLSLQLEAFTGSTEAAEQTFQSFKNTAIKTPFNLEQVAQAGKILLAFGLDVETAAESMDRLAIIAGSTGGDLNNLARNLGQISSQGRAFTRDLTQFAIQGIPIWEQLSLVTGKSTVELRKMAAEGQIGFKEVNSAIKLMTKEGSAFAEVGGRMQETWIGLGQAIMTEVQNLAKEFVSFVNEVDEASGGILKDSLKGIAEIVKTIAASLKALGPIIGFVVGQLLKMQAVTGILTRTKEAADGASDAFTSLGMRIEAMGAPIRKLFGIPEPIRAAKKETEEFAVATQFTAEELDKLRAETPFRQLAKDATDASKAAEELNKQLELEKAKLQEIKKEVEAAYDERIEKQNQAIAKTRELISVEKDQYASIRDEIKSRYDEEQYQLDEKLRKTKEIYDAELQKLDQISPAQKRLTELRKEELRERANSSRLSEKERLEAQVQLENMKKQEERIKIRKQQEEEIAKLQKQKTESQRNETKALEEHKEQSRAAQEALKEQLKSQQEELKNIKADRRSILEEMDAAHEVQGQIKGSIESTTGAAQAQVAVVSSLAREYANAARQAERLAAAASGARGAAPNRFAGGSVTGGSAYTVNELGQEAFLSASGKLSMIDAPAFGQWKAPGAGTVIPAHLTQQLNIPSGGTTVNRGAAAQTNRAASNGGDIAKAIRSLSSGSSDRITNNVTIQSANTTQAASDMMVQLNKIRRRRYS